MPPLPVFLYFPLTSTLSPSSPASWMIAFNRCSCAHLWGTPDFILGGNRLGWTLRGTTTNALALVTTSPFPALLSYPLLWPWLSFCPGSHFPRCVTLPHDLLSVFPTWSSFSSTSLTAVFNCWASWTREVTASVLPTPEQESALMVAFSSRTSALSATISDYSWYTTS